MDTVKNIFVVKKNRDNQVQIGINRACSQKRDITIHVDLLYQEESTKC